MLGVTLATLAGCFWLIMLPAHLNGRVDNPYIGLLIFIVIPVVFFAGLILIPIGIILGKRRFSAHVADLPDRRTAWRRLGIFFLAGTVVNVIIASQVSYRAVAYMETKQFCGQSCHVMKPEFTAWQQAAPHQQVACVDCHVEPGAQGWFKSKTAGTVQFTAVVLNSYPRPIPSAMESNKLSPSAETCERCHSREMFIGSRLRISTQYKDDEANTPTYSARMVLVGGGKFGGIHGAHVGPGVHIRYAAADKKRQNIPWVEYRNSNTGETRTYLASEAKPNSIASLPTFEFQCVDCHNRAAHSFEIPEKAVDDAITTGQIPAGLPFIKKTGVDLLKATYQSEDDAAQKIPAALAAFYQQKYPDVYGNLGIIER